MQQKNLEWIQCLRGVAALLVLLFHFAPQLERYGLNGYLVHIEKWGFWGVDIFFTLSGFVIAMSATKLAGTDDGIQFLLRRTFRVLLGYWPALALWIAFLYFSGSSQATLNTVSSVFLLSGKMSDYVLPIAWTLHYEMLFYLLFFFIISITAHRFRTVILQLLALAILAWNATWMLAQPEAVMAGLQPLRSAISAYFMEFFAGIFIYGIRQHLHHNTQVIIPLITIATLALVAGMQSAWFDKIEILRVATFGIAAAAVVSITVALEGRWTPRILRRIGDASYSLYITHITVISASAALVNSTLGLTSELGRALVLLTPVGAILFALLWYRFIENPLYLGAIKLLAKTNKPKPAEPRP